MSMQHEVLESDLAIFERVAGRMGVTFSALLVDAERDARTFNHKESALHDILRLYAYGSFRDAARAGV